MRKIELEMLGAIQAQKNWQSGNTSVSISGSESLDICVRLHGNLIAQIWPNHGTLHIKDAGWQTATTKSRLNAILDCFGHPSIYQKQFKWFLDDKAFPGWAKLPI